MSALSFMELLALDLENEIGILELRIESQGIKPTPSQKKLISHLSIKLRAVRDYNTANTNKMVLVDNLGAVGLLANTLTHLDRWKYMRGNVSHDAKLRAWVTKESRALFRDTIMNRLISALRKNYHEVVFVQFIILGDGGLLTEEKDE